MEAILPELLFIVSVVGTVHAVRHPGLPTQGLLASVHSFLEPGKQNVLHFSSLTVEHCRTGIFKPLLCFCLTSHLMRRQNQRSSTIFDLILSQY